MTAKKILMLAMCTSLSACVSVGPVKSPEDMSTGVHVETGMAGCNGCVGIKTLTSPSVASGLYAVKGANGSNTGQRISATAYLGITNRSAGLRGSPDAASARYLQSIVGEKGHLFAGLAPTDANHPYRFFVRIHHNSSFFHQNVFLVVDDGSHLLLPSFAFERVNLPRDCFNAGCVWDEDYVISAQRVSQLIDSGLPLKVFVGDRVPRQIQSADGLNQTYETVDAGVMLNIAPTILKAFIDTARQNIQ